MYPEGVFGEASTGTVRNASDWNEPSAVVTAPVPSGSLL